MVLAVARYHSNAEGTPSSSCNVGVYFLLTAEWFTDNILRMGSEIAVYAVHYADGTAPNISIFTGDHLRDVVKHDTDRAQSFHFMGVQP